MLQSRLENEQFITLPTLLATDRSRSGFITTDRPDSSQLVDLHVYIIPKNVWKEVQHLAQNTAMEEATSAGFVRVSPSMRIRDLRQSIEQLCGTESYFPRDFIFLRSVGRCLTKVKPKQENELKVKNYRPPQTFAPEIYLLEGRHEDYAHIPSASPAPSSASYVFGNRNQHRFSSDENGQSPSRLSQNYHNKPMRGGKHYPPAMTATDSFPQLPSSGRQSWAKYTQIGSDPEESTTNMSIVTSVMSRDLSKLKEEQERLRRRQAELERMRRAAEDRKARSDRDEEERRKVERAQAQREQEEAEERRRRQEKADAERRRLEQQRAEAEQRLLEQKRAEAEQRRLEQEQFAATRIQASYRGFKDRQVYKDRKRNVTNDDSRISSAKSNATMKEIIKMHEEETDTDDDLNPSGDSSNGTNRLDRVKEVEEEDEKTTKKQSPYRGFRRRSLLVPTPVEDKHEIRKIPSPKSIPSDDNINEHDDTQNDISQILSRSLSIGSTSCPDSSNTTRAETLTRKKERSESSHSNVSSIVSMPNQRKPNQSKLSTHSKTQETVDTAPFTIDSREPSSMSDEKIHEEETHSTGQETKNDQRPLLSPLSLPRSTPERDPEERFVDDEIETERREAEAKRRRQLEEEEQRRKSKELEEQRRRELAKRQREDPDSLRARLQELRARRADLEKIREEVIKHLKNIHNRITLRRKEARDMWKKKYFGEKKKTPPLEERITFLKADLEQIHKKTVQIIDAEAKHASNMGYAKEAEAGNHFGQVTRTHHDIQDIRHQVEQAKLRLTTDVKLRNQAENECRSLRHELNQAKMNLNHIKTRVGA